MLRVALLGADLEGLPLAVLDVAVDHHGPRLLAVLQAGAEPAADAREVSERQR